MKRFTAALGALLLLSSPGGAAAQPGSGGSLEGVPHLQVRGEAELHVPADQLEITIGVVTQAEHPETALDRNATRMQEVKAALGKAGLQEQEYRTGQFRIQPRWSSPPPRSSERPEIIAYVVTNTFLIQTTKLELAGTLIKEAVEAGANSIDALVFNLADPRAYRRQAIQQATRHAQADAEALAAAASVELKQLLLVQLDQAAVSPLALQATRFRMEAAGPPPIVPGEVTVRAGVALTYEIAPVRQP